MIKDPKRYRQTEERQHAQWLRRLTYAQSARLLDTLLTSRLIHELRFGDDDHPVAFKRSGYDRRISASNA